MTLSEKRAYNAGYRAGLKSLKEDTDRYVWIIDNQDDDPFILTYDGFFMPDMIEDTDYIAYDASTSKVKRILQNCEDDVYDDIQIIDNNTISFVNDYDETEETHKVPFDSIKMLLDLDDLE